MASGTKTQPKILEANYLVNVGTPYYAIRYAPMSGKLIFFKGMLMHLSENNYEFIFGYRVISNKTHLEYKFLPNKEHQFKICETGEEVDHTCATSVGFYPEFKPKSPNDMFYTLAIPHYS